MPSGQEQRGRQGWGHPAKGQGGGAGGPCAGTRLISARCPLGKLLQGEGACLGVRLQSTELQAGQASVPLLRAASVGFSVHLAANHA